ncbi:Tfp pilus assembly protein FimT/FimU [Patescibacteria group bacterium]
MRRIRRNKGFTLIEVLIALTIFMIIVTSISTSYLDIARRQREANVVREIYSEIRYVYNLIGEEARSKTIDYGCPRKFKELNEDDILRPIDVVSTSQVCSDLATAPEGSYLALINPNATERTIFRIQEEDDVKVLSFYKESKDSEANAWVPNPGFNNFEPIDLKGIRLNAMKFEIAPLGDPFDPENIGCGVIQYQPSVSVYTTIGSSYELITDFSLDLQTSFSSRVYNTQTNNL